MTLIPDQKNIKVHFATVENVPDLMAAKAAGVDYLLFTVYPLIASEFGHKPFQRFINFTPLEVPNLVERNARHTIMDSGLFTLMFGAQSGQKDASFIERWQERVIEFVQQSGYRGSMVEIDCQKVLGPEEAWVLRRRLREALPNRQINVFHIEDGYDGLDRLIEFTDYIAISIPEMRILKRSRANIVKLVTYIKNRKPEIDIHLLGCTDLTLLRHLSFASSCDSSSWVSSVRYGELQTLSGKVHIDKFKNSDLIDEYLLRVHYKVVEMEFDLPYINYWRSATLVFAAEQLKHIYTKFAGDQS